MTEISYIIQNGQQVGLKDTNGRALLAEKQNKFKAGKGIEIAADGTISTAGPKWQTVTTEFHTGQYESFTDTAFDITFKYYGNPTLTNQPLHIIEESSGSTYTFDDMYEARVGITGYNCEINSAIRAALKDLPDNGMSFLVIMPIGAKVTFVEEGVEGYYTHPNSSVDSEYDLSFNYIYIDDNGNIAMVNNRNWYDSGYSQDKYFYRSYDWYLQGDSNSTSEAPFMSVLGKLIDVPGSSLSAQYDSH